MINQPKALRELLDRPGVIIKPAAYDCFSARLIEQAGFELTSVSGAGVVASQLGVPDLGLTTMTELVTWLGNIQNTVGIPVLADADTGFGGVLNVMRTVQGLERAGVAGLSIEDQTANRRCGHFSNKSVIPTEEMVMKVKAAVKAKENPDFLIMARTDARAVEGLDSALARARAYVEAGAEALNVEAAIGSDEFKIIGESLADLGVPLKASIAEGASVSLSAKEVEDFGYKIISFPGGCQKVAMKAMQAFLAELWATGSIDSFYPSKMASLAERSEVLGLQRFYDLENELLEEAGLSSSR